MRYIGNASSLTFNDIPDGYKPKFMVFEPVFIYDGFTISGYCRILVQNNNISIYGKSTSSDLYGEFHATIMYYTEDDYPV